MLERIFIDMYDIYCKLRDAKKVKDADVVKATGITKSTFSDWKSGRSKPKPEKLQKIADYFGVTLDYLTGNAPTSSWQPTLTDKDERDLDKKVENLLNAVDSDTGLMLDGEIMDEETREIFAMNLKNALRTTKLAAKAKYTPNKYRK